MVTVAGGRLSRSRRGVGAESAGPYTIRAQPAAAEATGEALPFLHLSFILHCFFFSSPPSVLTSMSPISLGPISTRHPT